MTKMSISLVNQELQFETKKLKQIDDLKKITTDNIAKRVRLSRNTVSQYLNEMLKDRKIGKVKSRPAYFFDKNIFANKFFNPSKNVYVSLEALKNEATSNFTKNNVFDRLIGSHESLKSVVERLVTAEEYPPNGLPIILSGHTGVGKSYMARLIYSFCLQKGILNSKAPFIALNCAQYFHNPDLLSGNLFGYAKGSFTGADSDHKGLLEDADGGILFLDECHRLDAENQEKLFSYLDSGTFQRMGENNVLRKSKVRLIFATTENLKTTFLQTFLRRIPVAVTIPDLNKRSKIELEELVIQSFIEESSRTKTYFEIDSWIINQLLNIKYKSNVGELKNLVKLICAHSYSQIDTKKKIKISAKTIGHQLFNKLLQANDVEDIWQNSITVKPSTRLSEIINLTTNKKNQVKDLIKRLAQVNDLVITRQINKKQAIDIIARDSQTLMDQIVHQDKNKKDESLKYLVQFMQQIFDYLNNSFFINIKGNAVIAFANFIYSREDIDLALDEKTRNDLNDLFTLLKNYSSSEYQILKSYVELIKSKMGIELSRYDNLILLGYLINLNVQISHVSTHAIILAHGYSTASSIADVVNQFLHRRIFDAYDMPFNVSFEQVQNNVEQYIKLNKCKNGLIILVDMGSLMSLSKSLAQFNIPLFLVSNVSTQLALYVGEAIEKGRTFDEISKKLLKITKPTFTIKYPTIKKDPMIITTCHTGIGSAEQIKKLLIKSIPKRLNYKVKAVDLNYLKENGNHNPLFDEYDVKAIVGTNNPNIKRVPYIALEKLISDNNNDILQILFPQVKNKKSINEINASLIKNLSLDRLLAAVTILDVGTLVDTISNVISDFEKSLKVNLMNNQKITLYVHISSLIERLIRNEPIKEYHGVINNKRIQACTKIKRVLRSIEDKYGINIGNSEINYIYDIIFNY